MKNFIKKYLIVGVALAGFSASAQVIINADAPAKIAVSSPSVLLEFGNDNDKGLILPYVESLPADAVPGTIVYNASPFTDEGDESLSVLYLNSNGEWKTLTNDWPSGDQDLLQSITAVQQDKIEAPNAKTIIGAATSDAPGILVLESDSKAMVLPIVDNLANIKSPSVGMMVLFDAPSDPEGPYLAVYAGTIWNLWKPGDISVD